MPGFLARFLGKTKPKTTGSARTAKERLQFVLVHDRMNLSPEHLKEMKAEILAVISKYVSISGSDIDIAFKQQDRSGMLVAEIPFTAAHVPPLPKNPAADPESDGEGETDDE